MRYASNNVNAPDVQEGYQYESGGKSGSEIDIMSDIMSNEIGHDVIVVDEEDVENNPSNKAVLKDNPATLEDTTLEQKSEMEMKMEMEKETESENGSSDLDSIDSWNSEEEEEEDEKMIVAIAIIAGLFLLLIIWKFVIHDRNEEETQLKELKNLQKYFMEDIKKIADEEETNQMYEEFLQKSENFKTIQSYDKILQEVAKEKEEKIKMIMIKKEKELKKKGSQEKEMTDTLKFSNEQADQEEEQKRLEAEAARIKAKEVEADRLKAEAARLEVEAADLKAEEALRESQKLKKESQEEEVTDTFEAIEEVRLYEPNKTNIEVTEPFVMKNFNKRKYDPKKSCDLKKDYIFRVIDFDQEKTKIQIDSMVHCQFNGWIKQDDFNKIRKTEKLAIWKKEKCCDGKNGYGWFFRIYMMFTIGVGIAEAINYHYNCIHPKHWAFHTTQCMRVIFISYAVVTLIVYGFYIRYYVSCPSCIKNTCNFIDFGLGDENLFSCCDTNADWEPNFQKGLVFAMGFFLLGVPGSIIAYCKSGGGGGGTGGVDLLFGMIICCIGLAAVCFALFIISIPCFGCNNYVCPLSEICSNYECKS